MTHYFPEDITSQQQGHWILIHAYGSDSALAGRGGAATQILDSFIFFVPGGPTGGPLVWSHQHEYTDVKLARLFTSVLGVTGDILAGAATLMGTPINPRVDVQFRNTNLREYQFNILMAPQSRAESDQMKQIIKMLRFYAAPDFEQATGAELTYLSPNEFQIRFYYLDPSGAFRENLNMPKIAKGVIKRIDIDYTPQGEFSTFYDGTPVSAMLTFTFMETKIIGKKQIQDGF